MEPSPAFSPVDLLAFGAHPDDIEFGCGGVIAAETQAGRHVQFVVASRGEAATHGTPEERIAEAERAAGLLGARLAFVDLGGDAHLSETLAHTIELARIIRRCTPRVVLAPTLVENQHPDHVRLARMVRDAARLARYGGIEELRDIAPHAIGHLIWYAITPGAEPSAAGRVLVDVSAPAVLGAWRAAMEAHVTQAKTRDYVELQLTRARLNGLVAGIGHAIALSPNDDLVVDSLAAFPATAARRF